ncbi:HNH endonuclease [Ruegeria arenilitoris]|uniref:HNH endonuclease n=1 Tax=Ruegeria arenilitoris TaxID=1173585 RepID=UPI00147FD803|nr:HNH endonuclease [Ruegeria arenilitoris]
MPLPWRRRNRAAALAIRGNACLACGIYFGRTYGPQVDGYIEVHHVVPVSQLGRDYVINPKEDLVPLCPNCHSVAHRRNPPFTVDDIKRLFLEAGESSGGSKA